MTQACVCPHCAEIVSEENVDRRTRRGLTHSYKRHLFSDAQNPDRVYSGVCSGCGRTVAWSKRDSFDEDLEARLDTPLGNRIRLRNAKYVIGAFTGELP